MPSRLTPAALSDLKPASFDGSVYRVVRKRLQDRILSTEGNRKSRGRYHHLGETGVLYTSLNPETALEEVRAKAAIEGLEPDFVIGRIRLRLNRVLDLNDTSILKGLGLSKEELTTPDYSLPQAISLMAREAGFDGLGVPSATGKGENLIIFENNLGEGALIGVEEVRPAGAA